MSNTYSTEEAQHLLDSLLATIYQETAMKLHILQRSHRLTECDMAPQRRRRRTSQALNAGNGDATSDENKEVEEMLDDRVLDALKYERDLEMLLGIYNVAYEELCAYDGLTSDTIAKHLMASVEALLTSKSKDNEVYAELQAQRDELNGLQAEVERLRKEGKERLHGLDERIAEARHQLKCVHRVNELEYDLVQRWESSRQDQAKIWAENHERAYLCAIIDYKRRLADEQRMMYEVRVFRERKLGELQEQIAYWQEKYTREVNEKDKEIERRHDDIAQLHKSLERHREVYKERVAYVHEYELKKAEERRQHELQMHRIESAVRIQAWWRGTMVRRGLGPYKRKPKKGKKGKAKGK